MNLYVDPGMKQPESTFSIPHDDLTTNVYIMPEWEPSIDVDTVWYILRWDTDTEEWKQTSQTVKLPAKHKGHYQFSLVLSPGLYRIFRAGYDPNDTAPMLTPVLHIESIFAKGH